MHFVPLSILLFFALAANAQRPAVNINKTSPVATPAPAAVAPAPAPEDSPTQEQKRVAILNTEDDGDSQLEFTDLNYLNARLREIALKTLPQDKYSVMNVQSIIDKMGSKENARKICKEAQCMAEIGRKISAAYIGQARLGRFSGNLTISMELYNSGSGVLIGSFTGKAKDVLGLETIINENAPSMFSGMPDAKASHSSPITVTAPAPVATPAKATQSEMESSDIFCEEQRKVAAANFAASRKSPAKANALLTEAIAALDKCLAKNPSLNMKKKVEQNKEMLKKMLN
jgi:hypothetical protein